MTRLWTVMFVLWAIAAGASGLTDRKVSLEFKDVEVHELLRLLADAGRVNLVVSPCVGDEKLSLRLKNAPVAAVLDIIASRLSLTWAERDGVVLLECRAPAATPDRALPRVSLDVTDAPLEQALRELGRQVGAARVEVRAPAVGPVSLRVKNVRFETLSAVLLDTCGVVVRLEGDALIATAASPAK